MLNQVVLVGRLINEVEAKENEYFTKIAVSRGYKNENGEYDTDFVSIRLSKIIGDSISNYFKKGDLIGIRGRIESENDNIIIIAEKVTFLSSKKDKEEE